MPFYFTFTLFFLLNSVICAYIIIQKILTKTLACALTSVAQLVGHHAAKQKVTSSIPSQGTCLDCGFGLQSEHLQEALDQ